MSQTNIYLIIGIYCSHNRGQNPHIYSTNKKVEDSSLTKRKHFLGSSALLCVLNKRSHEKLMCAVCVCLHCEMKERLPLNYIYYCIYNTNNGKLEDFSLTKRKHFLGSSTLLCVLNKRFHEKLMCAVCVLYVCLHCEMKERLLHALWIVDC